MDYLNSKDILHLSLKHLEHCLHLNGKSTQPVTFLSTNNIYLAYFSLPKLYVLFAFKGLFFQTETCLNNCT